MQVNEPGVEITLKPEIGAPPSNVGAVQDTTDWVFAFEVATTEVGASGTVAGATLADGADAAPDPAELVAATTNVYEVPLVRPLTVHEVVGVVHVNEPGEDVTR